MKTPNLLPLAASFIIFTGCETDPCKDVVCGDHGQCLEGVCDCDDGFEKDDASLCNTDVRDKFEGTWAVSEDCDSSGTDFYNVTVGKAAGGDNPRGMVITHLYIANTVVEAEVSAGDSTEFTVGAVTTGLESGLLIEGTGVSGGGGVVFDYSVAEEATPDDKETCASDWQKQ